VTKPVWLLDVDGVLNMHPRRAAQRNIVHTATDDWKIDWNPAIIDVIKDVQTRDIVDIVWLTTWEEEIHHISALFDMPFMLCGHTILHDVRTADGKRFPKTNITDWSKREVFHYFRTQRPVIWTDDSAIDVREVNGTIGTVDNVLFIRPDYRIGLTPEHLVVIMSFIGRHTHESSEL
jgi:hypothetical protein